MQNEVASQWREVDIPFAGPDVANPYTDIDAWVTFTHSSGRQLRRPVFWDGGTTYRVRFASTEPAGEWQWRVYSDRPSHAFSPAGGTVVAGAPIQDHPHRALTRGFVTAHGSGRSFCYADGSPAFWVFDTAWALPFRATVEDVTVYAAERQAKGFNAVLLMSIQPDMKARGPAGRNLDEGFYLPCGDGAGTEPQVEAGGCEIEDWDAYGQATGIHYRPHHRNDEHQDSDWLDFQSCQTGHMGDHVPDRLATMWAQLPAKAIMNGEPSYEHSGRRGVAEGWWQGHEAWCNVCAGALMGVAYGAATLWQWRLHPDEPGHGDYFLVEGVGWREALDFEGSRYVGLVGKILDDLPIANASPCWDVSSNSRGLLDPGVIYVGYAEHGGPWTFFDADGRVPSKYWLLDARTGGLLKSGDRPPNYVTIEFDRYEPSLLICAEATPAWVAKQSPT